MAVDGRCPYAFDDTHSIVVTNPLIHDIHDGFQEQSFKSKGNPKCTSAAHSYPRTISTLKECPLGCKQPGPGKISRPCRVRSALDHDKNFRGRGEIIRVLSFAAPPPP